MSDQIITGKTCSECYHLPMRAAGFVLVGGMSTRMGQDKALLSWNSQYLVEKIAATVAAATGNVTLVGRPERYMHLNVPCIPDSRDGKGDKRVMHCSRGRNRASSSALRGLPSPLPSPGPQIARRRPSQTDESVGRSRCGVFARADGFGKHQHAGRLASLAAFVTIKDEEYCQIWQTQPKVRII